MKTFQPARERGFADTLVRPSEADSLGCLPRSPSGFALGNRARSVDKRSTHPASLADFPNQSKSSVRCFNFDLGATLSSGQVFRWWQLRPGVFAGWIGADLAQISQQGSQLSFQGTNVQAVERFFSLDQDLPAIARDIDVDPIIHEALRRHWGVRLIRQDPWECLAGFILSSFNNIVRLTGMLNGLAERFGEPAALPLGSGDSQTHSPILRYRFPRARRLARVSERALRNCGLGFRAPYLKGAAQAMADGSADLERWRPLEDEALRRRLLTIPGVGEKVVECVMLFSFGRESAFPVDVWIGRAMRAWYFKHRRVTDRQIREFALKHFGPHCGWAQQVLYCQARSLKQGR